MEECETIVVGAGLAGLVVASGLSREGADVLVLEKSRGLGGRMATRRTQTGLAFDHGAQFLEPETQEFQEFLATTENANAAALWDSVTGPGAYVGLPGMSGLVAPLAERLTIRFRVEVASVATSSGSWMLSDAKGQPLATCRRLVLAIPAPQAKRLLGTHPISASLSSDAYTPCWTLMAAFGDPLPLPTAARDPDATLSWIARDNSKPGRPGGDETWVAQAAPGWSAANLEREREDIRDVLLGALAAHSGTALPKPTYAVAHRWRYALVDKPFGSPCLVDAETALVAVGDWCLGPKAEHAFLSGRAGLEALRRL